MVSSASRRPAVSARAFVVVPCGVRARRPGRPGRGRGALLALPIVYWNSDDHDVGVNRST